MSGTRSRTMVSSSPAVKPKLPSPMTETVFVPHAVRANPRGAHRGGLHMIILAAGRRFGAALNRLRARAGIAPHLGAPPPGAAAADHPPVPQPNPSRLRQRSAVRAPHAQA